MRDMTSGEPYGHLWRYALPLLLGNWLQLAYNAVDSIIAGRFIGQNALAAEGIAAPVMNLVILAISGMCIGSGVLMSEHFGARNYGKLKRTMSTMLLFGGTVCLAVAGLGFIFAPQILRFMEVPEEIFDITVIYMRITFLGAPFTFFYNAIAAGMKSVGDSKTPLKFLMFSALLNAGLDLVFLGLLGFGIVCSAVTTVIAEAVSAGLAAYYMATRERADNSASVQGFDPGAGKRAGRQQHRGLQRGDESGRLRLHSRARHRCVDLDLCGAEPRRGAKGSDPTGLPGRSSAGAYVLRRHLRGGAFPPAADREHVRDGIRRG